MDHHNLLQLIEKYLNGESSKEEESLLFQWYNSQDEEADLLDELTSEQRAQLKKRMFQKISDRIEAKAASQPPKRPLYPLWLAAAGIAASVLLVFIFNIPSHKQPQTALIIIPADTLVKNTSDKIVKHTFPDKSVAWLKPQAELTYKTRLFNRKRNVSLKGEAFFEVTHDTGKPFIITSGKMMTRVVGTSFNIKSPANSTEEEVSVMTGKVMVYLTGGNAANQKEVYLLPNEKVVYTVNKNTLNKKAENRNALTIWKKSDLSFDNEPMKQVIKDLNENFDIDIKVKDAAINNYTLNGDFKNVNLPVLLELLQTSLDITYKITGKEILLEKNQ